MGLYLVKTPPELSEPEASTPKKNLCLQLIKTLPGSNAAEPEFTEGSLKEFCRTHPAVGNCLLTDGFSDGQWEVFQTAVQRMLERLDYPAIDSKRLRTIENSIVDYDDWLLTAETAWGIMNPKLKAELHAITVALNLTEDKEAGDAVRCRLGLLRAVLRF